MNIDPGVWSDIVSSDDSYTAHALPMDNTKKVNIRITLFIKSQEVTERLFNMWTSKSKSSISFLISEFNSMFGSNLTFFPTLLKFSLASVIPINTDSFFRMVKESYNNSRQIVENGGSLELYRISQLLNKEYAESIYHTHKDGYNSFESFGLDRMNVPYQLGVYPIGDPALMVILGPEIHNYDILSRFESIKNQKERNLFLTCHNLIPISNPEIYSNMNSFDNILSGMLRIEAATAPTRKLQRIKRQIDLSWEDIKSIVENDITILLREPETLTEMKIHTYQKLFSFGAAEALRDTASSIYYARVAASVSAAAFQIPYHDIFRAKWDKKLGRMIGLTYAECINYLINYDNSPIDISQFYPYMREYKDLKALSKTEVVYNKRSQFESQNVRTLQLTEITMRIKNPIRDLIQAFWVNIRDHKETSYYRDWATLKELIPIINDSLELTLDNLIGDKAQKIRVLLLIMMRIMGYNNKPMKAVVFGPSSRSYDQTYLDLKQQNSFYAYTNSELIYNQSYDSVPRLYDKLYYYYNIFLISLKTGNVFDPIFDQSLNIIQYLRDPTISHTSKKKIMIFLMYFGQLDDYRSWTNQTKSIMHYWIRRQKKDTNGSYRGNFRLQLQCGDNKMILGRTMSQFYIQMSETKNPMLNFELLERGCELLQMSTEDYMRTMPRGRFHVINKTIVPIIDPIGVEVELRPIPDLSIDVGEAQWENSIEGPFLNLYDTDGYQIMKTPLGLLPTDYVPFNGEIEDFSFEGMSILGLTNLKIFTMDFDFSQLSRMDMLSVLNDIDLARPKISDITKDRLKGLISKDWEIKQPEDYYEDVDEKFVEEDIFDKMMDFTFTEGEISTLCKSLTTYEDPIYDDFLNLGFNWEAINNLPTVKAMYQPQKILNRFLYCKYHLIARSCIDVINLSRTAISTIYKQTGCKSLVYALVYLYDKIYTHRDNPSPKLIGLQVDERFLRKFNINQEEYEIM
jgi:hypothetical protein